VTVRQISPEEVEGGAVSRKKASRPRALERRADTMAR
jgi:hypothetical protein